jgi:hypothetical protein
MSTVSTMDGCSKPRDGPREPVDVFQERLDGLVRDVAEDVSRALLQARHGDPARAEGYLGRVTRRVDEMREALRVLERAEDLMHEGFQEARARGGSRGRAGDAGGERDDHGNDSGIPA